MAETVEQQILDEVRVVKGKIIEIDRELHRLREEFEDTHLSEEERTMLGEALEEERKGETVSLERLKRELGYG